MARPLRIELPGAHYHATARRIGGRIAFLDDVDREHFLAALAKITGRLDWLFHGYCLLGNPCYFLIETRKPNLSSVMLAEGCAIVELARVAYVNVSKWRTLRSQGVKMIDPRSIHSDIDCRDS